MVLVNLSKYKGLIGASYQAGMLSIYSITMYGIS